MNVGRKTFVFDLDGTISDESNGRSSYHETLPNPLVVDCIRKLYELGHEIVIYTARGMKSFKEKHENSCFSDYHLAEMVADFYGPITKKWLLENDIPFHKLVFGKPSGDYYIDDKGMSIGFLIDTLGVA